MKTEIEVLYHSIQQLKTEKSIKVQANLKDLKGKGLKILFITQPTQQCPYKFKSDVWEWRDKPNIVIRRADKTKKYVALKRQDYNQKWQYIWDNTTKLTKLRGKENTETLKKKHVNKLIKANNADVDNLKIKKIVDNFPTEMYV